MKDRLIKILILIGLFLCTLYPAIDSDLGWHLRYGEYFFKTGHVLYDNILSFVWPNYHWVQASWGYDLLVYQIYMHAGLIGISIAAAATTVLVFFLITHPFSRLSIAQYLWLAYIFIAHSKPLYSAGFRSQTPSTVMFAIALIVMTQALTAPAPFSWTHEWRMYILPFLFLLWANLHGGFALGLILFFIYWSAHGILLWMSRATKKHLTSVHPSNWAISGVFLLLSVATPLLNPWGAGIYGETFKHVTNINLTGIVEWMPLWTYPFEAIVLALLTAATVIFSIRRKKPVDLPYICMLIVSAYLAESAIRFTIIFAVVFIYYWAQTLPHLKPPQWASTKWTEIISRAVIIGVIILDLFFVHRYMYIVPIPFWKLPTDWNSLCKLTWDCDEPLTALMRKDPPKGNGYHPYNWGGYLSWRVPQVKTFIDGRMAAWEDHGKTPAVIEGDWVNFQRSPVTFRELDSQYHFAWVIVPSQSYIADYMDELVKDKLWERRYRDEFYSYYVKK
ncbi:MAG TPA: hypothetical protein VMR81_06070 [Patescibacteria group bacterium]|nr:hypothetical protein [Patescibacteria group bacterium]